MSGAHAHHGHHHGHHHHSHGAAGNADWRYGLAIVLNLGFVGLEATFGFLSNSTALLADAGHNLSDVLSLVLAGGAAWLARRQGAERRTYGFGKATILAALTNAVVLIFACGAIALEAIQRFEHPPAVQPNVIMAVAGAGFVINLATALLFLRGRAHDVNIRGAFLHMAADAGVSLAVVASGLLIAVTGMAWIDPAASLLVVIVVLIGTWELLKESLDLAMDVAPSNVSVREVRDFLCGLPGVHSVHDMHVWNLSTTETALTAHLVRAEASDNAFLSGAMGELRARYGIRHATIQVEVGPQDNCPNC